MHYDEPSVVHARIDVNLMLKEYSVTGTLLDLQGLSRSIEDHLKSLGVVTGGQVSVVEVSSPTKGWEIHSQLDFENEKRIHNAKLDSEVAQ